MWYSHTQCLKISSTKKLIYLYSSPCIPGKRVNASPVWFMASLYSSLLFFHINDYLSWFKYNFIFSFKHSHHDLKTHFYILWKLDLIDSSSFVLLILYPMFTFVVQWQVLQIPSSSAQIFSSHKCLHSFLLTMAGIWNSGRINCFAASQQNI